MPEIQIRPAQASDIPILARLEPNYSSDFVWQMDIQSDETRVNISFREVRLPRSVRVEYPRSTLSLLEDWEERDGILVALSGGHPVGYACLDLNIAPATAWITDLVVEQRMRRQGIGSALLIAAQEWARHMAGEGRPVQRIVLEMQPKNAPAISLAFKLGFDFGGYNDRYYANHDIALFFSKPVI